MAIEHVTITDPNIHEPKGASTATANTVYISNGAGSGAWDILTPDNLEWADVRTAIQEDLDNVDLMIQGNVWVFGKLNDVSTASSEMVTIPMNCTVVDAVFTMGGAITTADATVSFKNAAGAAISPPLTVEFATSGKGVQYTGTATANNVLTGPTWIEIETDGASDTACPLYFAIRLSLVALN